MKQVVDAYAYNGNSYTDKACTKLTPYGVTNSLTLITRYGVGPISNRFRKFADPSYIRLCHIACVRHSVHLVCYLISAISVFDKSGENLASTGSESHIDKLVHIGGESVLLYSKTVGAGLVELNVRIEE